VFVCDTKVYEIQRLHIGGIPILRESGNGAERDGLWQENDI
jgi:hypothetical protein